MNGSLGEVIHYAIRVEFQVRGSPHIHALLWVKNACILHNKNTKEYAACIESVVKCEIPSRFNETKLHELVKTYQTHSHSKSCRKYKNLDCRYHYGRYFTNKTIITEPLPQDLSDEERANVLKRQKSVLDKVKKYIDTNLNPRTVNIFDEDKDDYCKPKTISEILEELEYYRCLSTSDENSFQIHLKRAPDSCFINNYFKDGLLAWEANLDIQPVLDYYKAVSYMCAYLSKAEDESSEAMQEAVSEAYESGLNVYERMKSVAKAYRTHREMSVQEAVSTILPEIWLRKTSPGVIFANSNLPEKRYRVCRSEEQILELPEDSNDLFKRNMLDRYMDRPDNSFCKRRYRILDSICYAQLLANYVLDCRPVGESNDYQPEVLEELLIHADSNDQQHLPNSFSVMSKKERLKLRKKQFVLRYHVPNHLTQPEAYSHHLLIMFYPFRNESELNATASGTYAEKLAQPEVLDIVNRNKMLCEPYGDVVDEAFINFSTAPRGLDSTAEQENDKISEEITQNRRHESEDQISDEEIFIGAPCRQISPLISDEAISEKIGSLNCMQREVFERVNKWVRNYLKSRSSNKITNCEPMHLFLTGSAGCGKSHLLSTIKYFLLKSLSYQSGGSDKEKLLMLAPTGVAAVNIDGSTIHSALGISPERNYGKNVAKMSDKRRSLLRNKLSELCIIIIDEISMVSNVLLLHIHQRLMEIFGCSTDLPFAGISIIACGDFYQLPPIQSRPVFADFKDPMLNMSHCWRFFKLAELTEVMRQRGDLTFISLLNNIRIGKVTDEDLEILKSRFFKIDDPNYPVDAIHIWAENHPVNEHNKFMLTRLPGDKVDKIPEGLSRTTVNKIYQRSQMNTGGLAHRLLVKIDAKVMLTSNIDVGDKLCNGQIGTIKKFKRDKNGEICTIYLKMEEANVGLNAIRSDSFGSRYNLVPIKRIEKEIKVNDKSSSASNIKRFQFPVGLSWACTVHKVQGKTFQQIVISFDLCRQKRFNVGQIYVALSRVTSLNGLYLTGTFNKNSIKADKRVINHYEHLRKNCQPEKLVDCGPIGEKSIIVTLLNVQSLFKHAKDVAHDLILMESDLICFTETQIGPNCCSDSIDAIQKILTPFSLQTNNLSDDKFCNLAIASRGTVEVLQDQSVPCVMFFQVMKESFLPYPINILLVCRKNTWSKEDFLYLLDHFIRAETTHIILGDFNINAFGEKNYVPEYLSEYEMIINTATHISGSLLDHVYILKDLKHNLFNVHGLVKCVYYSDHDAVKFILESSDELSS